MTKFKNLGICAHGHDLPSNCEICTRRKLGHCIHGTDPEKCSNCKTVMRYSLDADQVNKMEDWKRKINDLIGEYGQYDITFSPTGIGVGVKVYSHLINKTLDLTDIDKW